MGTELAQLEAKVRELTERLAHADRLACLGQMSAGIAHEINNPVAYVLANLTALTDLLDGLEAEQLSEAAHQAVTGAREIVSDCTEGMERIRRISSDLKRFARVEEASFERIDVNDVVEAACHMADNELRHRARLVIKRGSLPPLMADAGKLTQVILNLLINAAQAIDEGNAPRHRVSVETLCEEDVVTIRVSDTGRGMSEATRARIFEPFFTTKPKQGGTGLGLWLAQEIVRRHDGEITVSSSPGRGATFDVRLPVRAASARTLSPESAPPAAAVSMAMPLHARVLLIDDDAALRRALRRMLRGHHEIIEADGGEAGIAQLRAGERFDAVLCDLMMPDVDGVSVHEYIAAERPELLDRLAFLSGGAFTPRARAFLDRVQHQVVEKPVSREALLRVIAGLVESAEADQRLLGASK